MTVFIFDGDINNCGGGANNHGICLRMQDTKDSTFNIAFGIVSSIQKQEFNVKIDSGCFNVSVYANEHYKTENPNACPDTCFVVNPADMASIYNAEPIVFSVTMDDNDFANPLLVNGANGWSGTSNDNVVVDSTGKVVGDNSLKVFNAYDADNAKSISIYQNFTGLNEGDYYMALCVVNVEQTASHYSSVTERTPYIIMATDGRDSQIYASHAKAPNSTGKHLLMQVGKVSSTKALQPQFHVYNNDGIYYFGNFMLCNLNALGMMLPASASTYDDLYSQLQTVMNSEFEGAEINININYTQIMNIVKKILTQLNS